jgi:hypothetical protein
MRTTLDIDVIILLDSRSIAGLERVFPDSEFYCPPRDVVEIERGRENRGHFNLIHLESGFKADVYVSTDDPLQAWAINERRLVDIDGTELWLAPPEYVIVYKLQFYREGGGEKHLRDIRGMLLTTDIDQAFLEKEIAARALGEAWRAVEKRN